MIILYRSKTGRSAMPYNHHQGTRLSSTNPLICHASVACRTPDSSYRRPSDPCPKTDKQTDRQTPGLLSAGAEDAIGLSGRFLFSNTIIKSLSLAPTDLHLWRQPALASSLTHEKKRAHTHTPIGWPSGRCVGSHVDIHGGTVLLVVCHCTGK